MKFGKIHGNGGGNGGLNVRREASSISLYCSLRATNNLTQLFGTINEMNEFVVTTSVVGTSNNSNSSSSALKPPANVSIQGDLNCLHCKGNTLFAYCNACSKWYCSATCESVGKKNFHTCPVHGRAQIVGTRNINPESQGKKK